MTATHSVGGYLNHVEVTPNALMLNCRQRINQLVPEGSSCTALVRGVEIQDTKPDLSPLHNHPLGAPRHHNASVHNGIPPGLSNTNTYTALGTSRTKGCRPKCLTLSMHQLTTSPNAALTQMVLLKK